MPAFVCRTAVPRKCFLFPIMLPLLPMRDNLFRHKQGLLPANISIGNDY